MENVNNLRLDIFRQRILDKNTLTTRGSLYIGTGTSYTVGGVKIYEIDALEAGDQYRALMIHSDEKYGVGYRQLITDSIEDGAITGAKIANGTITGDKIANTIEATKITGFSIKQNEDGSYSISYEG